MAAFLGAAAAVVSRVGHDDLGHEALSTLRDAGLDTSQVQVDSDHPTGTAIVSLDSHGLTGFTITEDTAWDFLCSTPELAALAARTDAVCFGTLAQRSAVSRRAIRDFLAHTPPQCLKVLDVNLRPPYDSPDLLKGSLPLADVLKLSREELPRVLRACGLSAGDEVEAAYALQQSCSLRAVCITRGEHGSVIATEKGTAVHPGVPVQVVDTVGAGDAFTAAMTLKLLAGAGLEEVSHAANAVGAWVASQPGAMPAASAPERARLRRLFGSSGIS
jgi:fructokinase